MRIVIRLIKYLIALVIILVAVAFLLPREVSVDRSIAITAPASQVFPHVNSLKAFAVWSPWADYDPDMAVIYSGPDAGVGNRMDWTSTEQNVGSGSQVITESVENEKVVTALDFGQMGTASASFTLVQSGATTTVTWGFVTDLGLNPFARWMGLMMESWVGADYEKGLARLKIASEAG